MKNLKSFQHVLFFIIILTSAHLFFYSLYYPGANSFLFIIPIIYSVIHFFKVVGFLVNREYNNAFFSIFNILLFISLSLEIFYQFYNLLLPLVSILLGIWFLRKKQTINNLSVSTFILLSIINVILIFTPNSYVLKFLNKDYITYRENLNWKDFDGKPDSSSTYDALIHSKIYYKINYMYNYPPAILISRMNQNKSWKKNNVSDNNTHLLKHEQVHFDITESFVKLAQDSVNKRWGASSEEIELIVDHFIMKSNNFQTSYDKLTKHGTDSAMQAFYNNVIGAL